VRVVTVGGVAFQCDKGWRQEGSLAVGRRVSLWGNEEGYFASLHGWYMVRVSELEAGLLLMMTPGEARVALERRRAR